MKQQLVTKQIQREDVRGLLEDLYDKADGDEKYPSQPYSKWDADYARRISEAFGIRITLRAGRSKYRGATLSIITEDGVTRYEITMYENQPGNLEHEISHYIQFGLFGRECLMDRKNYAIEEIRAESTAYVICMMTGNRSREGRSVPYVRKYAKEARIDPRTLIPEIEERVAEFMKRGVMPPVYAPIVHPPRFRYGRCRKRLRHVFEIDGGEAQCIRCSQRAHALVVRMYGEPAPIVA